MGGLTVLNEQRGFYNNHCKRQIYARIKAHTAYPPKGGTFEVVWNGPQKSSPIKAIYTTAQGGKIILTAKSNSLKSMEGFESDFETYFVNPMLVVPPKTDVV